MEENVMNNVVEEFVENIEVPEEIQNKSVLGEVLFVIGAIAATGIGMLVHKNKDRIIEKRTARQIENLKKKGYLVYKEVEIDEGVEEIKPIE